MIPLWLWLFGVLVLLEGGPSARLKSFETSSRFSFRIGVCFPVSAEEPFATFSHDGHKR